MIFPSFIGGLSLNTQKKQKKMRVDQEVIVSAGPVSPIDEMVVPPMAPSVFFPMSVDALDLENMSDLIINEIVLSDTDTDSESDIDDTA